MPILVPQPRRRNVVGQVEQVVVLCLLRQVERTLCDEVACRHGHGASAARGSVSLYLHLCRSESAVGIAQEDEPQDGHTVLIRGEL